MTADNFRYKELKNKAMKTRDKDEIKDTLNQVYNLAVQDCRRQLENVLHAFKQEHNKDFTTLVETQDELAKLFKPLRSNPLDPNWTICQKEFAEYLSLVMIETNMTKRNVSDMFGVSITTVNRWRNGESAPYNGMMAHIYLELGKYMLKHYGDRIE